MDKNFWKNFLVYLFLIGGMLYLWNPFHPSEHNQTGTGESFVYSKF